MVISQILIEKIKTGFPNHTVVYENNGIYIDNIVLTFYKWKLEEVEMFHTLPEIRQDEIYREMEESITLVLKLWEQEKLRLAEIERLRKEFKDTIEKAPSMTVNSYGDLVGSDDGDNEDDD